MSNMNIFVATRRHICLWIHDWSQKEYKSALDYVAKDREDMRVFMLPQSMPYAAQKAWIAQHFAQSAWCHRNA
jgi:hypothetical protein